jgi:hypothetical protein
LALQSTGPETPFFDYGVAAKEAFAIPFDRRRQPLRFPCRVSQRHAHQYNAGNLALAAKDQIAEILILG